MKWFQHHTDAHDDEFVQELMHKFGSDGYTAWFITIELVGKIIKVIPEPESEIGFRISARLEATPRVFTDATKIHGDRLEKIYEYCAQRKKFRFKRSKERWVVDWPKVLEFKDNAAQDAIYKYGKKIPSNLVSDLVSTTLDPQLPIEMGALKGLKGIEEGMEGGLGETGHPSEMRILVSKVVKAFRKNGITYPGRFTMQDTLLDLIRQGGSVRLVEEAPMNPTYAKMGFYKITDDLKMKSQIGGNNANGTNGRSGPGQDRRGGGTGLAQSAVSFFTRDHALPEGELGRRAAERIRQREERGEGTGALPDPEGNGSHEAEKDRRPAPDAGGGAQ